eukprot:114449-Amphidinium_carterae.1
MRQSTLGTKASNQSMSRGRSCEFCVNASSSSSLFTQIWPEGATTSAIGSIFMVFQARHMRLCQFEREAATGVAW